MEFNADLYEDVYYSHVKVMTYMQKDSMAKYHCMMADLYTQAS